MNDPHASSGVAGTTDSSDPATGIRVRRRIAIVLWDGSFGGAESFSFALALALRRQGFDPWLLFMTRGRELEQRASAEGIPSIAVRVRRGRELLARPWRLADTLESFSPNSLILPTSGFLAGVVRVAGFRGTVISVEHGDVLQLGRFGPFRRLYRRVDRLVGAPFISHVVCVSDYIREVVESLPHRAPISTIKNGVDLSTLVPKVSRADTRTVRIAVASRLIPGKGIDVLLRAISNLPDTPRWECHIAGDGPERLALEAQATRSRFADRIHFRGWVSGMAEFWQSADIAVVPSAEFVESFGMTALEAMACGIPVVCTRNGGLPEVVQHERTGFVVPSGDSSALSKALSRYLEHSDLRTEHGRDARLRCESEFDIHACAAKYAALLER